MHLKYYFYAIAAGLVFCCATPLAADSWTSPAPVYIEGPSYAQEFPAITASGNKLFFSSDSDGIANGAFDLYYSVWQDTSWSAQIFISSIINGPGSDSIETSPAVGYDDTTLYFVRGNFQDSIWVAYYTNGNWTVPLPLDSIINSYESGGPAISKDGSTLYFHSNRPGGYGGNDIWKAVKSGGLWQEPVNMGPDINTAFNETEFSLAGNDSDCVFYRSSDTSNIWYYNMGSGDAAKCLFYSHYDSVQYWNNYWYFGPCISWDAQKIYLSYSPEAMEYLSYIRVSDRLTGVEGGPIDPTSVLNSKTLQNAPNPFTAFTNITYQLPTKGKVTLKIYNISGQLVKTLAEGEQYAGRHNLKWNGDDMYSKKVAAGIYLCRLAIDKEYIRKSLILVK